jgi:hypothetical protein
VPYSARIWQASCKVLGSWKSNFGNIMMFS